MGEDGGLVFEGEVGGVLGAGEPALEAAAELVSERATAKKQVVRSDLMR